VSGEGLRARWDADVSGAPGERSDAAFADLIARYREPHRRYHTTAHLDAVFDALDLLGERRPAVRLAAWYHDVIYDPTASDNEAASAALARHVLPRLGVDPTVVAETARLIELTRDHAVAADDTAGAALIDADLSVLGADPSVYDRYATSVRAEYGHVSDGVWRAGRAAVLRSFLDRPVLFLTGTGRDRWEGPARVNLTRELHILARGSGHDRG
jgi:predicted metal-dependent HD superfamily phosphohydrolase